MAKVAPINPPLKSWEDIPDEYLEVFAREFGMATPWQYAPDQEGARPDPDTGRSFVPAPDKDDSSLTRGVLQEKCFLQATRNPQVATAIRGRVGRLTGLGFEMSSAIPEIRDAIKEITFDPRNRLYNYWPKFVHRSDIEGELFLCLTCHTDGFIEVDFIDPAAVKDDTNEHGIITHPFKKSLPLIYCIKIDNESYHIPSIFIAHYPEWIELARGQTGFSAAKLSNSKSRAKAFKKMGGFRRFIVAWDKGLMTVRNISHVRTILEWSEYFVNMKKYEMDHKKSCGAYAWEYHIDDPRIFFKWMNMSDSDRAKVGMAAPKGPGGMMVTGPKTSLKAVNPNLPNISGSDSDLQGMVQSGLDEPKDVTTGDTAGSTFASLNASRGPMSDRVSDNIAYFERFLRHDFWGSIFWLKSKINGFPETFKVREATGFKNKKPVFSYVKYKPEELVKITFPVSETTDIEGRVKAMMGVKHGPLSEVAGIPKAEALKKLGFGNYLQLRLDYETEKEMFPDLPLMLDAESAQEKAEAEPGRKVQDNGDPQTE